MRTARMRKHWKPKREIEFNTWWSGFEYKCGGIVPKFKKKRLFNQHTIFSYWKVKWCDKLRDEYFALTVKIKRPRASRLCIDCCELLWSGTFELIMDTIWREIRGNWETKEINVVPRLSDNVFGLAVKRRSRLISMQLGANCRMLQQYGWYKCHSL